MGFGIVTLELCGLVGGADLFEDPGLAHSRRLRVRLAHLLVLFILQLCLLSCKGVKVSTCYLDDFSLCTHFL